MIRTMNGYILIENTALTFNRRIIFKAYTLYMLCKPQVSKVFPLDPGYVFDLTHTCTCIQISLVASEGLIAAIIVIVGALLATGVTG